MSATFMGWDRFQWQLVTVWAKKNGFWADMQPKRGRPTSEVTEWDDESKAISGHGMTVASRLRNKWRIEGYPSEFDCPSMYQAMKSEVGDGR